MFYALEEYYKMEGDDVLVVHSHKFYVENSSNEKDFIVLNLTKGKCARQISVISKLQSKDHMKIDAHDQTI